MRLSQRIGGFAVKGFVVGSIILSVLMTACNHSRHSAREKVIVLADSLPEGKRQLFDSLKYGFNGKIQECLTLSGFERDCGDHDAGGYAFMFLIDIDTIGHVAHCDILGEDICGANRQKAHDINKCVLQDLNALVFPPSLRDMKLKFSISAYVKS